MCAQYTPADLQVVCAVLFSLSCRRFTWSWQSRCRCIPCLLISLSCSRPPGAWSTGTTNASRSESRPPGAATCRLRPDRRMCARGSPFCWLCAQHERWCYWGASSVCTRTGLSPVLPCFLDRLLRCSRAHASRHRHQILPGPTGNARSLPWICSRSPWTKTEYRWCWRPRQSAYAITVSALFAFVFARAAGRAAECYSCSFCRVLALPLGLRIALSTPDSQWIHRALLCFTCSPSPCVKLSDASALHGVLWSLLSSMRSLDCAVEHKQTPNSYAHRAGFYGDIQKVSCTVASAGDAGQAKRR